MTKGKAKGPKQQKKQLQELKQQLRIKKNIIEQLEQENSEILDKMMQEAGYSTDCTQDSQDSC